jgi:SAM-dependent methyltransferase
LNFFDLVNISERYMELLNPSTPEKMMAVGRVLRLPEGGRVIDFGCGFGEQLALWGQAFGISGVGIDIRPYAAERAARKLATRGLSDRIEIVCANAAEYVYAPHSFDAAVCLGASFIWKRFPDAIHAMKPALRPGGRLAIGEPYWLSDAIPAEYKVRYPDFYFESELLAMIRQEGFELEYVLHASTDDWDRYESDNWMGLVRWLEETPDHPEREQVVEHLHAAQEDYLRFGRQYLGWGVYMLAPHGPLAR